VKRADAPPEGWYPDPSGGTRLRWWDGVDWADSWRSPGQHVGAEIAEAAAAAGERAAQGGGTSAATGAAAGTSQQLQDMAANATSGRHDQERLLADMRRIARSEVDRMAGNLTSTARDATAGLETTVKSLADEYGPVIMRWLKRGVIAVVVGVIMFNILQAASGAAQLTLVEWLGERLDALTSTTGLAIGGSSSGVP